jgi:hypothetical protein
MTTHCARTPFPPPATPVVTDAGLETWLVFERGIELPGLAAYPLVATPEGRALLTEYYDHYMAIAERAGAAIVLEAPTWRANPDWAATLGHDRPRRPRAAVRRAPVGATGPPCHRRMLRHGSPSRRGDCDRVLYHGSVEAVWIALIRFSL